MEFSPRQLTERLAMTSQLKWLAGLLASIGKSAATQQLHLISYCPDGYWVNRQRAAVFFSPTLHTSTVDALTRQVNDFWLRDVQLQTGDVVVDVGAGVGDDTLVFARRVGTSGRVVAIEAHPSVAACLSLTVAENKLANVEVVQAAAWDIETTLDMTDESIHEGNAVNRGSGSLCVRARPIDAVLDDLDIDRIALIKINIEGAEATALKGMTAALERTQAIVVSCHDFLADTPDDFRRTKAAVIEQLHSHGFETKLRTDSNLSFVRDYVYGHRP